MKWTPEAEAAIKKVPFFVRKKVRTRVEKEAGAAGKHVVSVEDVKASQARYLSKMGSEIKGYQIDTCFGPSGCPNRAIVGDRLVEKIETLLKKEDLLAFLKQRVQGDIKFHHEFRVALADCPNACSQPQIKDIGIIGACNPALTDEACSECEACVEVCKENAITINNADATCEVDYNLCLQCGLCIDACPTGTITAGNKGFRVQIGGKLGRHPQLARELPGIFSEDEVLAIVKDCIAFYKRNSKHGQRFAQIFTAHDFENLTSFHS
jgi:anaerobic sulfite reductase subunit C